MDWQEQTGFASSVDDKKELGSIFLQSCTPKRAAGQSRPKIRK